MKEISKENFIKNIETLELTEPIKITGEDIVVIPFEEYAKCMKIIDPEKLEQIEKEIAIHNKEE